MAELSDLSVRDRIWFHRYRFRTSATSDAHPLEAALSSAKIALVSSAGLHALDDTPFKRQPGGDPGFRVIPHGADLGSLVCTHPSKAWERSGVLRDVNVALPIDRLSEMVAEGVVGSAAPRHLSIQGSITAPAPLVNQTIPEMMRVLTEDRVQAVVLTPV